MNNTGSLVDNRSNPYIFVILAVLISVAAVLVLVRFLITFVQKQKQTPEWQEAQKKRPTKRKNVEAVAKSARLTGGERDMLYAMCRKYQAPNIEYLVRDDAEIQSLCGEYYAFLSAGGHTQEEIAELFSLRFKLEKLRDSASILRSTQQLAETQQLTYVAPDKSQEYTLPVLGSDAKTLQLLVPDQLAGSDKKPKELAKIKLSFTAQNGISYRFESRAVRYETTKDGHTALVVTHAPALTSFQRRQTKRMPYSERCTFSAAKPTEQKDRDGNDIFEIKENRYPGTFRDISAAGCQILVAMPIGSKQYMQITFPIDGEEHTAIGYIVSSRKAVGEDGHELHIRFVRIELPVQNRIYAHVYGYLQ